MRLLTNRTALLVFFAAVVGLPLLIGGLMREGEPNVTDLVKGAFSSGDGLQRGKIDATVSLQIEGTETQQSPSSIRLSGPFEATASGKLPRFDLTLSAGTVASNTTYGVVNTADKGYLRAQGEAYQVPVDIYRAFKAAYEQAAKERESGSSGPNFASLGVNPVNWLEQPEVVGNARISAIKTTHISGDIDIDRMISDLSELGTRLDSISGQTTTATTTDPTVSAPTTRPGLIPSVPTTSTPTTTTQEEQPSDIATEVSRTVESAKADLYIGESDGLLRKLELTVKFNVPKQGGQLFSGTNSGTLKFVLLLQDIGEKQNILEPAGAKSSVQFNSALEAFSLSEIMNAFAGSALGSSTTGTETVPPLGTDTTPSTAATTPLPPVTTGETTSPSLPEVPSVPKVNDEVTKCILEAGSDIEKARKCVAGN